MNPLRIHSIQSSSPSVLNMWLKDHLTQSNFGRGLIKNAGHVLASATNILKLEWYRESYHRSCPRMTCIFVKGSTNIYKYIYIFFFLMQIIKHSVNWEIFLEGDYSRWEKWLSKWILFSISITKSQIFPELYFSCLCHTWPPGTPRSSSVQPGHK